MQVLWLNGLMAAKMPQLNFKCPPAVKQAFIEAARAHGLKGKENWVLGVAAVTLVLEASSEEMQRRLAAVTGAERVPGGFEKLVALSQDVEAGRVAGRAAVQGAVSGHDKRPAPRRRKTGTESR